MAKRHSESEYDPDYQYSHGNTYSVNVVNREGATVSRRFFKNKKSAVSYVRDRRIVNVTIGRVHKPTEFKFKNSKDAKFKYSRAELKRINEPD